MIELGIDTLGLDNLLAQDPLRQSFCYTLALTSKDYMAGMSRSHRLVRKCHSQDFIHPPCGIASHCKNIPKCLIFSCLFLAVPKTVSVCPCHLPSLFPFIPWAKLPIIANLVQSSSKGLPPSRPLPALVQHHRRV